MANGNCTDSKKKQRPLRLTPTPPSGQWTMTLSATSSRIWCIVLCVFLIGCSEKTNAPAATKDSVTLPQPTHLVRRSSGFDSVSFSVAIDFENALVTYTQINRQDAQDICQGSVMISDEIEAWQKTVANVRVCFGVHRNPKSDGFQNSLIFNFPKSTALPPSLEIGTDENYATVRVQETLYDFVAAEQQFDCNGYFAIDALIKSKIECLKIDAFD